MSGKADRWLSALVIITVASGCDNVDWGGAEVRLVHPPSRTPDSLAVEDTLPVEPDLGLPEGPVLYVVTREGDRATVVPAAEIRGDTLVPVAVGASQEYRAAFAERHLQPGSGFFLFSRGARVGRVRADTTLTDQSFCTARPAVAGVAELLPTAATADRYLALAAPDSAEPPRGDYQVLEDSYAQRAASVEFEIDLLRRIGARFPTGPIVESRVEIRPLRLGPTGPLAFTTTFVNLDVPRVAPADSAAWATFLLGVEEAEDSYRLAYEWHRSVGDDGKGVPLLWSYMDWDGDGEIEILLEVVGAETRWTAAVTRRNGQWQRTFQDPCGTTPADSGGG